MEITHRFRRRSGSCVQIYNSWQSTIRRVIVIASSLPNEGKSVTAINLALALAEAEHSVVIVDGDMRKPFIDKYLGLVGQVGFSTVLSGGAALSEALQDTPDKGRIGADVRGGVRNPSELLGSQAARILLGELREKFDYVIVDSTPLLAVTDAALLATSADAVLLVAKFGHTKMVSHAAAALRDVGAPLLGAVFTMMPTRGAQSYSYEYAYYGDDDARSSRKFRLPRVGRRRSVSGESPTSDGGDHVVTSGSEEDYDRVPVGQHFELNGRLCEVLAVALSPASQLKPRNCRPSRWCGHSPGEVEGRGRGQSPE